jgi:hypothetical protein
MSEHTNEEIIESDEVITDENDPTSTHLVSKDYTEVATEQIYQEGEDEEYVSIGYNIFQKRTRTSPIRGPDGILRGQCNTCHQEVEIDEHGRFNKCSHCGSYDLQT